MVVAYLIFPTYLIFNIPFKNSYFVTLVDVVD